MTKRVVGNLYTYKTYNRRKSLLISIYASLSPDSEARLAISLVVLQKEKDEEDTQDILIYLYERIGELIYEKD